MLGNGILQDTFGMLSFLRRIGLRINGRMLGFFRDKVSHKILCFWDEGEDSQKSYRVVCNILRH